MKGGILQLLDHSPSGVFIQQFENIWKINLVKINHSSLALNFI